MTKKTEQEAPALEATPIDYSTQLQAPFPESALKWRVGRSGVKDGKVWAMLLCYIDARLVAQRLDEVFGPAGWSNQYDRGPGEGTLCGISALGVTKWDGAQAPDTEPVKGVLSDSFKRAAVMWGIGRYLYDIPEQFAEVSMERKPRSDGWTYATHADKKTGARYDYWWRVKGEHAEAPAEKADKPGWISSGDTPFWESIQMMLDRKEQILERRICTSEKEEDFLLKFLERFDTYGEKTHVSPAQKKWLEEIWERVHLVLTAISQGASRAAEEPQAPSVSPELGPEPEYLQDGPPDDEDDLPF